MEQKLLNGLTDLGYSGPLLEQKNLAVALQEGAKNIEYTKLVNFLTNELRTLLSIDEEVNPILCSEDAVAFIMEVSSFLKELNCTYSALTQGHISDRLQNVEDRLLLLDYLITELMAARILQEKKPDKKIELKLQETEEAANLRKILMTLRFPKPPPNITIQQLFQKVCPTVQTTIQKVGKELVGNPAFTGTLSDKQWKTLNEVQKDLHSEYKIRREMLLTRLDVTIQSFQWSDKTKGKNEIFEKVYAEKRKRLKTDPEVELADLLAARDDIAIIEKTSNSTVRKNTQSALNKVIIGQVPDRGGRTSEQAPPPPEMPSWQQRSTGPPRGGRGGGNYSRGDYGNKPNYSSRDSGSYSGQYSNNQSGNYSNNQSGNYSSGQSSYDSYGGNKSNYSGNSYSQGRSFDSAGSYGSNYPSSASSSTHSREGNYGSSYSTGREGYSTDNKSNYDNRNFDSAGSYGKDYHYEQSSKRPKTYDTFQSNRTTHADQYVQEEQHNQQYQNRGSNRSRGRGHSNYGRGGRSQY